MTSILAGPLAGVQPSDAPLIWFLIKATLILLCALGVTFAMHRTAAGARHLVWLVTLGALLLVPALSVWSPLRIHILPAQSVATTAATGPVTGNVGPLQSSSPNVASRNSADGPAIQVPASPIPRAEAPSAAMSISGLDPIVLVFAAWLLVALGIGVSLVYASLSLHWVVRASKPLNGQDWLNAIWEVSDRLGLRQVPRLRQSATIKMPFACGVLRPTIVLPAESENWSQDRRHAVLLHELAHVKRHDLIGHTVGRIACALYWFHPLVWTAAKRLRSESERACDDLALICGTHASDYAEHLLEIVTSVRRDRTPMVALAMARRKEFEGRMLAILDPQLRRTAPNRWKTGALVASLGLVSVVVGAAAPVARTTAPISLAPAAQTHLIAPQSAVAAHEPEALRGHSAQAVRSRPDTDSLWYAGTRSSRLGADISKNTMVSMNVDIGRITANAVRHATADVSTVLDGLDFSFDGGSGSQSPDERAQLLAKVLQSDTSATIRNTAAWGLAQYAESDLASTVLTRALLHDASATVRETSAWALSRDHGAKPAVVQALGAAVRNDASDPVRATSAWTLGEIRDDAATPALTAALGDKNSAVRTRAVWAIGQLRPRTAPAALIAKLKDSDPKVREVTAWALHSIRDTASIPALESALHSETDKDLQADYIHALASMDGMSIASLRTLLESPDPRVKSMAVDALAGGHASGPWPWPWPEQRPRP
jgi:beta-lactamase regulating signal transducer with metallopeptidase domain